MARGVVVIGASAGGVDALLKLTSSLTPDFPAPILVVLHIGPHRSILPQLISDRGPMSAAHAVDGEPLTTGRIHVAPPDNHMLVEDDHIRIYAGPKENHSRPAIDPLFSTAALFHGPGVAGLVLTGRLDDGTAGLQAIKSCGGVVMVQDPEEAEEPSMPRSALKHVQVDHCARLDLLAPLLHEFARAAPGRGPRPCHSGPLAHEIQLARGEGDPLSHMEALGQPSTFTCPDCGGALWELRDSAPVRYRCHTGHAFTLRTLQHAQSEATDQELWAALRALQEKEFLLRRLARAVGTEPGESAHFTARADEIERRAENLRGLIEHNQ